MDKYQVLAKSKRRGFSKGRNRLSNQTVILRQLGFPEEEAVPASLIQEITLLKSMTHPNLMELFDVVNSDEKINIVLVYEFLDTTLTSFMRNNPDVMKIPRTIKELLCQILLAVSYYHSFKVIHGGIKPENMFIDTANKNTLKITDFIWPRTLLNSNTENPFKESMSHYKAPETLIEHPQLSTAIDVWSVGCVFAELVTQKPLFPAENEFHQLTKIFSIMGKPNEETWPGISGIHHYLHVYSNCKPKDLRQFVPGLEPAGIDLLNKLLCMDPKRRITANKALEHEYFAELIPKDPN